MTGRYSWQRRDAATAYGAPRYALTRNDRPIGTLELSAAVPFHSAICNAVCGVLDRYERDAAATDDPPAA